MDLGVPIWARQIWSSRVSPKRSCKMQFRCFYLSWLPIVCVGCQSCQQLISAAKALNKVTRLKTCVLPMAMTMFMYILCEGLVEPKQILFFSCCPSSHCQLLQYNQMKKKCINILLRIQILQTFLIFWPSGCLQSQDKEGQQGSSTKQ